MFTDVSHCSQSLLTSPLSYSQVYTSSYANHSSADFLLAAVLVAYMGDRFKMRGPFILMFLPLAITGYILAVAAKTDSVRYAAVFLMSAGL